MFIIGFLEIDCVAESKHVYNRSAKSRSCCWK